MFVKKNRKTFLKSHLCQWCFNLNKCFNNLNLLTVVKINGQTISYIYDATGVKLQKKVTSGTTITTDYAEGRAYRKQPVAVFSEGASWRWGIYVSNHLQLFNPSEGYVEPINASNYALGFRHTFQFKDHLGNIRLSYKDLNQNTGAITLSIVEEHNYYPFGLKHKGYNANIIGRHHKYMFGGKELQDEIVGSNSFEVYDFGARNYDAALGRWMNIDPLSQFPSPYNYTGNNPVNFIDPDGRYSYNWNTNQYENSNGEVVSWEEVQANNFEEPSQPEDIIFRDLTGKEVARYVTTEFNDEVVIPLYLSIGFSSIDLNKKYEGLDLDDLDAIGLSGGFGYYFGAGGGKSWSVVYFMDGKDEGTHEFFTTKSSGLGLEGYFGSLGFGVEFFNFLKGDDNFSIKNITGSSYSLSASFFNTVISYTYDSDLPEDTKFRNLRTVLGSGSALMQSVKIGGVNSESFGFSWTRNITAKGID